ncbi:MAG: hypothetical protein DRQ51_04130 [Gammaproteobacteria bacterium]|nr:MAG: hypothetical protein DRQ51_04130 [Gammaproteobacteria bacterium]
MSDKSKGMFQGLMGVLLFSLILPITKYIIEYFNPIFIGLGRSVVVVAGIIDNLKLIVENKKTTVFIPILS